MRVFDIVFMHWLQLTWFQHCRCLQSCDSPVGFTEILSFIKAKLIIMLFRKCLLISFCLFLPHSFPTADKDPVGHGFGGTTDTCQSLFYTCVYVVFVHYHLVT